MPQRIDVPGMGVVEFPDGMDDAAITSAIQKNLGPPAEAQADQRPFLEKLGSFARNVYNNPPPTIAAARDIIKGVPAAAQELTFGADPEAAREAAGTAAQAAAMGLAFKGPGGTNVGVAGRPIAQPGSVPLALPPMLPREAGPSAAQQAVEAGARQGIEVPRFLASEGTATPQYAAGIGNLPFAGEPIVRAARALPEQMGAARARIAPSAATPELAGEQARTGLTGWIKIGSQKPVSEAYRAVDELVDPNIRIPLDNTRAMVGEIMAERTQGRIPGKSAAVDRVLPAVQDPVGMDYQGTKILRSFLGETTPQELVAQGIKPTEAKRLYGAMTKDLGAVLRESSPEAFSAWHSANRLASLTKAQQNALTKITGAAGDAAPEAVFNTLVRYAGGRGGADLRRLRLAKEAMGPAAWGEVGSALIHRLGTAPDGSFSPDRFVTAWGNLAPAARNVVFSGQQLAALIDLFTLSSHVQRNLTRFQNPSGTSRGVFSSGFLGGALLDPVSVIGGLVGTRLAAEALSRPAVVRAASQVTRAQLTRNPVATRRALERLRQVAVREGLISAAGTLQQNLQPAYTPPQPQR